MDVPDCCFLCYYWLSCIYISNKLLLLKGKVQVVLLYTTLVEVILWSGRVVNVPISKKRCILRVSSEGNGKNRKLWCHDSSKNNEIVKNRAIHFTVNFGFHYDRARVPNNSSQVHHRTLLCQNPRPRRERGTTTKLTTILARFTSSFLLLEKPNTPPCNEIAADAEKWCERI